MEQGSQTKNDELDRKKEDMIRLLKDQPVSVRSSGSDKVSLTLNSRFEVTEVHLKGISLPHAEKVALQDDIAKAVNSAVMEVAKAVAKQLGKTGASAK